MNDDYLSYAVILSGGKGTRLSALTARRAKPAVPIMGSYRMIDFPLSNCARSNIDYVSILTQYEPDSLERHIRSGYPWKYDERHLAVRGPREKREGFMIYSGTAAAVRETKGRIDSNKPDIVLILSGDHVYSENYKPVMENHMSQKRDLTIYTKVVPLEESSELGVMKINDHGRIIDFYEKPKTKDLQEKFKLSEKAKQNFGIDKEGDFCLASMGIYVFTPDILYKELSHDENETDFGKHIIPRMISEHDIYAHIFKNYWEDVGTLDKLVEANFHAITRSDEIFNSYLMTNMRDVPPAIVRGNVDSSVIAPGSIIEKGAIVKNSIIGYQTIVKAGAHIEDSILHGGDRHYTDRNGRIIKERYSVIEEGAVLKDVLLDRNIKVSKEAELIGKKNRENTIELLNSLGLSINSETSPEGIFDITPNGILVFGKPIYGKEQLFPENFKI